MEATSEKKARGRLPALLAACAVSVISGLGFVGLANQGPMSLGLALFFGAPFVVGFLTSWIYCTFAPVSTRAEVVLISQASILLMGVAIIVLALDGLLCVAMAYPPAALAGFLGAFCGHTLGRKLNPKVGSGTAASLMLLLPLLMGFESRLDAPRPLREVTTSILVDAPTQRVWKEVIGFDRIDSPPSGIFRLGIAYPVEARIEGHGVGAVRHCTFSTGSFVEPITRWQEPILLTFNVVENPPPMKEFSPYAGLDPPHLHGLFESTRGRFRLSHENGRTRLEGTTWYRHGLAPDFYWGLYSDAIIHRIHRRVLEHIKTSAERPPTPGENSERSRHPA